MSAATETKGTSFGQTEVWIDRQGVEHRVDEMSVRYKANVIRFIERRAPRIVGRAMADALIKRLGEVSSYTPCVGPDGVSECNIDQRGDGWAHGVFHGAVFPGSEIDNMLGSLPIELPTVTNEEAVEMVRRTPFMQRLIEDVEHGRGGDDG